MKTKILTVFSIMLISTVLMGLLHTAKASSVYTVYVYDSWGEPIEGANVIFEFWNDPWHDSNPFMTIENTTDSNGQTNCTSSSYVPNGLNVTKDGYVPYYQKGNVLGPVTEIILWGNWTSTDWTETDVSGQWQTADRTEWRTIAGQEDGSMNWTRYIVNFTGYHAEINFTHFEMMRKEWWWATSEKEFIWSMEIKGSINNSILIYARFRKITNTWGLIVDQLVNVDVRANNTEYYSDGSSSQMYWDNYAFMQANYLEVFAWREDNNLKVNVLLHKFDRSLPILMKNASYALSDSFFMYVKLSNRIRHKGYGYFTGGLSDNVYADTPYLPTIGDILEPSEPGFFDQLAHDLSSISQSIIPQWIRDTIGQFTAWGNWLLGIIGTFFGMAMTVVPIIPLILGFYVLDAGVTSVNEGSFQPMGYALQTIYAFVTQIIHVLVAIAQTIYDFIHFW